jgi:hypothetical protein
LRHGGFTLFGACLHERPHLPIRAFVATNKNDAAHFMIIVLCG